VAQPEVWSRGGKIPSSTLRPDGYLPIGDYGAIGDCRSLALVGVDGSIDWCCLPRFDSPSVFGRILDSKRGGFWQIAPDGEYASRHEYADKTNILRTIFQTPDSIAIVTDFMPVDDDDVRQHARPHRHPRIVRMVTGLAGDTTLLQHIEAAPDYARGRNPLRAEDGLVHGDLALHHLCISGTVRLTGASQKFTVRPGETVAFGLSLNHRGRCGRPMTNVEDSRRLLRRTQEYWWRWLNQCTYGGPYQDKVLRSALVLKLLTYAPTGAIVAAPTTSLPEWIGGPRNWDYRYTWMRDASFTLYSLFQLGFAQEATDFMNWLRGLTIDQGLKILYTLDGHGGGAEQTLDHLDGYRGSRPVRIRNAAENQLQLDIFGEIMDTVFIWTLRGGKVTRRFWDELVKIVDFACTMWELPDAGLWEVRGENLHFTYSKVMCWVAIDRGLRIASRLRLPAPRATWRRNRDLIHSAVMMDGWSRSRGSFTQSFESDRLDASVLRLVQLGFLPDGHRRLRSTIAAIDNDLSVGPLVFRYHTEETDDGLDSPEGSLVICGFWLADALALVGKLEDAQRRFERLLAFSSPLGLFAEEVDPRNGGLLGNYPQAFSHLAMISAAVNIERRRENTLVRKPRPESRHRR
jgi:GH15 family glucan-1,4-alpha-glucosidase